MTKNEYIASVMLEAADLMQNDPIQADEDSQLIEAIEFCIDNANSTNSLDEAAYYLDKADELFETFDEAYEYNPVYQLDMLIQTAQEYDAMNESAGYDDMELLIEASIDLKSIGGKAKDLAKKSGSEIEKVVQKVVKWYYKIEPNKRFAMLHSVIRYFNSAIHYVLSRFMLGGVTARLQFEDKIKADSKGIIITAVSEAILSVIRLTMFNGIGVLGAGVATTGGAAMYAGYQYKYNIRNFDANLKALEDGKAKLVDKKDPKLSKAIANYDKAITQLKKEKAKWELIKSSPLSARGAAIRHVEKSER